MIFPLLPGQHFSTQLATAPKARSNVLCHEHCTRLPPHRQSEKLWVAFCKRVVHTAIVRIYRTASPVVLASLFRCLQTTRTVSPGAGQTSGTIFFFASWLELKCEFRNLILLNNMKKKLKNIEISVQAAYNFLQNKNPILVYCCLFEVMWGIMCQR